MARRSAAETQALILEQAQRLLVLDGPARLRLDDVAKAVGISRQAVLHHFGSREGLMREVVARAWAGLFEELAGLGEATSSDAFVDRVDEVTRKHGNARLGGWLLLSGQGLPDEAFDGRLAHLAGDSDEARFATLAVGAALFGDAVFGAKLRLALGMPDTEADRERFRRWLGRRLDPIG